MNNTNCNTNISLTEITPAEWSQAELLQRAGGLVREALAGSPTYIWQMHREDMLQTAVITFLEHRRLPADVQDQGLACGPSARAGPLTPRLH